MLVDAPQPADLHLSIAHSLKTLGRQQESIEAYRAAAAARPNFGDAYWSLANLKTYRFADAEIAAHARRGKRAGHGARRPLPPVLRARQGARGPRRVCRVFGYYERGNALKKSESRYRAEVIEPNTRKQIEICTREFFARRAGWGAPSAEPIFIVGLPRAGSTLLEQILASHSQVEGTQELADVPRIVVGLQGREPDLDNPRYPGVLAELARDGFSRAWAKNTSQDTHAYRNGKPYFIDKMPNNFRHIGLIHLMLPNAKIIDARREPMACCFSNFKQLFARGQEFTYSIEDIARYYRIYLELMQHWDAVLPGKVLRVQHEDVVEDLEGSVRRMLEFCGLEFEPACLEFSQHRAQRAHGEFRAGAPADLSRGPRPVEAFRALAGIAQGGSRRCAGELPRLARPDAPGSAPPG